jgi:hypothetical protein
VEEGAAQWSAPRHSVPRSYLKACVRYSPEKNRNLLLQHDHVHGDVKRKVSTELSEEAPELEEGKHFHPTSRDLFINSAGYEAMGWLSGAFYHVKRADKLHSLDVEQAILNNDF